MKSRIADKISFSDKNTSKRGKILTKSIFFLQKSYNKGGNSKKSYFLDNARFLWDALQCLYPKYSCTPNAQII